MGRSLLFLAISFSLACVNGGDDSTAKPQGSLGGPCFANDTCNSGLDCVLQNGSGICEQGDATVSDSPVADTGSDTTTSDAPLDAPVDVIDDTFDAGCTVAPGSFACNGVTCSGAEQCCEKQGQCTTASSCNMPTWACDSNGNCANGFCCILLSFVDKTSCPMKGDITMASDTMCSPNLCQNGFSQTCKTSAECPSIAPTCTPVAITSSGNVHGFCM